jgi:hypothetical protein
MSLMGPLNRTPDGHAERAGAVDVRVVVEAGLGVLPLASRSRRSRMNALRNSPGSDAVGRPLGNLVVVAERGRWRPRIVAAAVGLGGDVVVARELCLGLARAVVLALADGVVPSFCSAVWVLVSAIVVPFCAMRMRRVMRRGTAWKASRAASITR